MKVSSVLGTIPEDTLESLRKENGNVKYVNSFS